MLSSVLHTGGLVKMVEGQTTAYSLLSII